MPPKKKAPVSDEPQIPASPDTPEEEDTVETKSDAVKVRKVAVHPSTVIMVREALTELDSRKGVSSQAIQNFIKQKYPSVDVVRLKYLVRKALKKGLETGMLVRPANASVTTGALGKFRLAPKLKEPKSKTENLDPNVQKSPKAAKDATKKKTGTAKKETAKEPKSAEESEPPKKSKKDVASTSKTAAAKKPKVKKAAEDGDTKAAADSKKTKAKAKETKAEKDKAADGKPSAPKASGKRGKKTTG